VFFSGIDLSLQFGSLTVDPLIDSRAVWVVQATILSAMA
jgi:hypothetical protein